jgi:hypothetical protein
MKISFKKMSVIGLMALTLAFGGAVAGASSSTFTSHVQGTIDGLLVKAAGWAGLTVATNAENQEDAVEKHVADEFAAAKTSVVQTFGTEVNRGNGAINDTATTLKTEITQVKTDSVASANAQIKTAVDDEVTEANGEILAAAKAKADSILAANQVPAPSAHPER